MQGDCDHDYECQDGLICGDDNCPGFPDDAFDCCVEVKGKSYYCLNFLSYPIPPRHTRCKGYIDMSSKVGFWDVMHQYIMTWPQRSGRDLRSIISRSCLE